MTRNQDKASAIKTDSVPTEDSVKPSNDEVGQLKRACTMISPTELCTMLGVSQATLWRMQRRGVFPKRTKISPGRVGWQLTVVHAWLEERR